MKHCAIVTTVTCALILASVMLYGLLTEDHATLKDPHFIGLIATVTTAILATCKRT